MTDTKYYCLHGPLMIVAALKKIVELV
jgi:hypothetical protein